LIYKQKHKMVGTRVREARQRAGISMKELARMVGVSYSTLYRVETGKVSPSVALLSEIAHVLGQPVSSFFAEDDQPVKVIRAHQQAVLRSSSLKIRLLVPKGVINDKISIVLGETEKGLCIGKHRNSGHELAYMIKGKCILTHGTRQYELSENDVVYFSGDQLHSVVAIEPLTFVAIYFRP